eukprot:COSAG01_NODE_40654_length_461_cov_0.759669_1_plen_42_part_01
MTKKGHPGVGHPIEIALVQFVINADLAKVSILAAQDMRGEPV